MESCAKFYGLFYLYKMKIFRIQSPSGQMLTIWAETIYHAVQKAMVVDGFKYKQNQYR